MGFATFAHAATITVTSEADSGGGTLREAITLANTSVGVADIVEFHDDVTTLTLVSALPAVTDQLTIDGTAHHPAGSYVAIGGAAVSGAGLTLSAPGCEVSGLFVHRFGGAGIQVTAADAMIRGNVLSGNRGDGIFASTAATGLAVHGNIIGLDVTGTAALGNTSDGVEVRGENSVIGTGSAEDRNIISGNGARGVNVLAAATNTTGNYIGTDISGTVDLGNTQEGIYYFVTSTGTVEGNVASGNGMEGIEVDGGAIRVLSNIVGLNAAGTQPVGNTGTGIRVSINGDLAMIGEPGRGNTIAGNVGRGITVSGTDATIRSNTIGLLADGVTPAGNQNDGILLNAFAAGAVIGGTGVGEGNLIVGNAGAGAIVLGSSDALVSGNVVRDNASNGIVVSDDNLATGNMIVENSIHDNAGVAIGVGWFGPVTNDMLDVDTGGNRLQNTPVLGPVMSGDVVVRGMLRSTANREYRIDLYRNSERHASGYGDAGEWLGATTVMTDGDGETSLTLNLAAAATAGEAFAATATSLLTNDTSGISRGVIVEEDALANATVARNPGYANPSEGPAVAFDVTFDEPVSVLSAADFSAVETGGLSGSSITSIATPWGGAVSLANGVILGQTASTINLANRSFTIEFWVNRGSVIGGDSDFPVSYYAGDGNHQSLSIGWFGGYGFQFGFRGDTMETVVEWGLANEWEHWACTFDNATLERRIYRNGVLMTQGHATAGLAAAGKLFVGTSSLGDFAGKLDELRVWDVVRTEEEIQGRLYIPAAGSEPGLLALYRFDAAGNVGADVLGNSPLSVIEGTAPVVPSTVFTTSGTVTVAVGTGRGTLGIDAVASGSATDRDGFPLAASIAPGETFTIQVPSSEWMILGK